MGGVCIEIIVSHWISLDLVIEVHCVQHGCLPERAALKVSGRSDSTHSTLVDCVFLILSVPNQRMPHLASAYSDRPSISLKVEYSSSKPHYYPVVRRELRS